MIDAPPPDIWFGIGQESTPAKIGGGVIIWAVTSIIGYMLITGRVVASDWWARWRDTRVRHVMITGVEKEAVSITLSVCVDLFAMTVFELAQLLNWPIVNKLPIGLSEVIVYAWIVLASFLAIRRLVVIEIAKKRVDAIRAANTRRKGFREHHHLTDTGIASLLFREQQEKPSSIGK